MDHHPLPADLGVEILRSEVGSTLHGTGLPGHEDRDEMGIFVESVDLVVGFRDVPQYIWRSVDNSHHFGPARSGPGDTDLTVYSLRKWARLALSGNPTVLLVLWSPESALVINTDHGRDLRANARWFASRRAGAAFGGYLRQQRQRMTGERGRAGRVRVMADGQVDWKYAMHMLRLGHQGVEFLHMGRLTLPVPGVLGDHLRAVRRGDVPLADVLAEAVVLEQEIDRLTVNGPLPDEPDVAAVEKWLVAVHLDQWGW